MRKHLKTTLAVASLALVAAPAAAQQMTAQCRQQAQQFGFPATNADRQRIEQYCNIVAQTVELTQPRLGAGLSGGNPVPGTASTIGRRLGAMPRFSLNARVTAAVAEIPDISTEASTDENLKFPLGGINADAALGVFNGFSPAPTVGGLGSLDLIGSVGIIPVSLVEDEGFSDENPVTWAAGARLGLLRESFTLPGVSVTGMYRKLGEFTFGDEQLQEDEAFFRSDLEALSVRGAISKDFFFLGLTAGAGWDRYTSNVSFGATTEGALAGTSYSVRVQEAELETDRTMFFGNVSLNFLIVNLVGEVGWQEGGELLDPTAPVPPGSTIREMAKDGALFGSVALRLSI